MRGAGGLGDGLCMRGLGGSSPPPTPGTHTASAVGAHTASGVGGAHDASAVGMQTASAAGAHCSAVGEGASDGGDDMEMEMDEGDDMEMDGAVSPMSMTSLLPPHALPASPIQARAASPSSAVSPAAAAAAAAAAVNSVPAHSRGGGDSGDAHGLGERLTSALGESSSSDRHNEVRVAHEHAEAAVHACTGGGYTSTLKLLCATY